MSAAELLAWYGDPDQLRAQVRAGWSAAELLARRRDLDGLRALADTGNWYATELVVGLLTGRGDLDGAEQLLRAQTDAGDGGDADWLADLLAQRGQGEEAERLRRFGLNPDGSVARE